MARESMYLTSYLEKNRKRQFGNGVTVSTFLGSVLRGAAKTYSGRYARALYNSLDRAIDRGEVIRGPSAGGADAFYPFILGEYSDILTREVRQACEHEDCQSCYELMLSCTGHV